MNEDTIITQELQRGGAGIFVDPNWRGHWWVREYTLPFHVRLVQWCGTRREQSTTGLVHVVSVFRYWRLWWRLWFAQRRGAKLPSARVLP